MKTDRVQAEDRIRAAIKTLLSGEAPQGMKRDITSLCDLAGVPRATMYRTYPHLKADFEEQRSLLHETAATTDSQAAPDQKQQPEKDRLKFKLAEMTSRVDELEDFKSTALSRLAAQHEEILQLRSQQTRDNKVQNIR